MRIRMTLLALAASVLCAPSASGLAEFGIEGMTVVSTRGGELRASVAPDGQRIVWASDRDGGAGGWDLWQATLRGGRWMDAAPLPLNTPGDEVDPFFSVDGRWLYFASNRRGGRGGHDLHRAPVAADGSIGTPQTLGDAINSRGDERAPALNLDGTRLLFASDAHGSLGGHDLFVADWDGKAFVRPVALAGVNSSADEADASWLGDGRALVFSRVEDATTTRLWVAQCAQGRYIDAQPLAVSFNSAGSVTRGAVIDASKPGELLLSGQARAPRAGGLDIYRMKALAASGDGSCVDGG